MPKPLRVNRFSKRPFVIAFSFQRLSTRENKIKKAELTLVMSILFTLASANAMVNQHRSLFQTDFGENIYLHTKFDKVPQLVQL